MGVCVSIKKVYKFRIPLLIVMINKKAQATSWSLKETGELLLRIIAVIVLLVFIAGIITILNKSKRLDNSIKDFDRILSEIIDLQKDESIKVPVLSSGYKFIVRPIEQVVDLGLSCKVDEGNYCACLKSPNDAIIKCQSFELLDEKGDSINIISDEVEIVSNRGITLIYQGGTIRVE